MSESSGPFKVPTAAGFGPRGIESVVSRKDETNSGY